jgi:hypothetical protein
MYITVSKKPSKEEITMFNMKVSEGDSVIDHRIELDSLDEKVKKALCEYYNLSYETLSSRARVTFSYTHEV